ncbi:MAG TPA: hypothetical protein VFM19_11190 [Candidatus Limnocylindria bacterium]|nr:hypothetical protein [Candidatus Limnocylindria bacterium]
MVIAALATFAALLVAWLVAPSTERRASRPSTAPRPTELVPEAT